MPNVELLPKNVEQVREVLIDFPANLEIELEISVSLDAKTVEDLRKCVANRPRRHSRTRPSPKVIFCLSGVDDADEAQALAGDPHHQ